MNNDDKTKRINPFFAEYDTPHGTPPFDKIMTEDYEEAFMEGIRRDDEEIEKIINDTEEPTFENTIIRVDNENGNHYYDLLSRVSNVFSCMLSAETNDNLDNLAQKLSPILTKHANDVRLNKKLFERVKHVYEHHRELTDEEQMLLNNCYDGFVRSGALLDDEGKEHLRKLTEEASLLGLQFSQNLLKENKAFTLLLTDENDLDGLPDSAREAAALAAKEAGKEGWLFTLAERENVHGEEHRVHPRQRAEQHRYMQAPDKPATRDCSAAWLRHLCRLRAEASHGIKRG